MSAFNGMQSAFREGAGGVGADVIYVSRMPWITMNDFFLYRNRPNIDLAEATALEDAFEGRAIVNPSINNSRDLKYGSVNTTVHARTPEIVDDAIEETRAVLRRVRGVKLGEKDNFELWNAEGNIRQFNEMTVGIKVGAFVIGTIALLVAGIGIMNIMLVSVTERTKEIGIRKALGARPRHILRQFLMEAVLLCNMGGIIGVLLGFGLGNLLVKYGVSSSFETDVPLEWAVIGLLFCTVVGVIYGMLPAIKASRLNPIDALRYE